MSGGEETPMLLESQDDESKVVIKEIILMTIPWELWESILSQVS